MNYIATLKAERDEARAQRDAGLEAIAEFRAHLFTSKFTSDESERRDWIATSDVLNRLSDIRDKLYGIA